MQQRASEIFFSCLFVFAIAAYAIYQLFSLLFEWYSLLIIPSGIAIACWLYWKNLFPDFNAFVQKVFYRICKLRDWQQVGLLILVGFLFVGSEMYLYDAKLAREREVHLAQSERDAEQIERSRRRLKEMEKTIESMRDEQGVEYPTHEYLKGDSNPSKYPTAHPDRWSDPNYQGNEADYDEAARRAAEGSAYKQEQMKEALCAFYGNCP